MGLRRAEVRFSDDVETHLVPRVEDAELDDHFYLDSEIATFRYEAFMEKCGLNVSDFPDAADDSRDDCTISVSTDGDLKSKEPSRLTSSSPSSTPQTHSAPRALTNAVDSPVLARLRAKKRELESKKRGLIRDAVESISTPTNRRVSGGNSKTRTPSTTRLGTVPHLTPATSPLVVKERLSRARETLSKAKAALAKSRLSLESPKPSEASSMSSGMTDSVTNTSPATTPPAKPLSAKLSPTKPVMASWSPSNRNLAAEKSQFDGMCPTESPKMSEKNATTKKHDGEAAEEVPQRIHAKDVANKRSPTTKTKRIAVSSRSKTTGKCLEERLASDKVGGASRTSWRPTKSRSVPHKTKAPSVQLRTRTSAVEAGATKAFPKVRKISDKKTTVKGARGTPKSNSVPNKLKTGPTLEERRSSASHVQVNTRENAKGKAPLITHRASTLAKATTNVASPGPTVTHTGGTKKRVCTKPAFQRTASEPVLSARCQISTDSGSVKERLSQFEALAKKSAKKRTHTGGTKKRVFTKPAFQRTASEPVLSATDSGSVKERLSQFEALATKSAEKSECLSSGMASPHLKRRGSASHVRSSSVQHRSSGVPFVDKASSTRTAKATEAATISKSKEAKTSPGQPRSPASVKKPLRQRPNVAREDGIQLSRGYSCSQLDRKKEGTKAATSKLVKIQDKRSSNSNSVVTPGATRLSGRIQSWKVITF